MIFLSADTKNINIGGNNDEYGSRRHDKKLRTDRNMTQEEVAEYLGISFQAVSKWETGVSHS